MKQFELLPDVLAEFEARGGDLLVQFEERENRERKRRCLECGFPIGAHCPDCEQGRQEPGYTLIPGAVFRANAVLDGDALVELARRFERR